MPCKQLRTTLLTALLLTGSLTAQADRLLFAPSPLNAARTDTLADTLSTAAPAATPVPAAYGPASRTGTLTDAATLRQLEYELGAFAPELAQAYLAHARGQQTRGQHRAALETLAKALHSERLQEGLFTPTQFEAVALQVQSHLALDEHLAALERQQHLLFLQRRAHGTDSVETIEAQEALGDLYFEAFRKVLFEPQAAMTLKPAYGALSRFRMPEEYSRHQLAYLWLGHARDQYQEAIATLLQARDYEHARLVPLEQQLLQILLLQAFERQVALDPHNFLQVRDPQLRDTLRMDQRQYRETFYRAGIEAHERMLAYRQAGSNTDTLGLGDAMLALGD